MVQMVKKKCVKNGKKNGITTLLKRVLMHASAGLGAGERPGRQRIAGDRRSRGAWGCGEEGQERAPGEEL